MPTYEIGTDEGEEHEQLNDLREAHLETAPHAHIEQDLRCDDQDENRGDDGLNQLAN